MFLAPRVLMLLSAVSAFVVPLRTTLTRTRQQQAPPRFFMSEMSAEKEEEEEWFPRDPAFTTPQLMVGLWSQIAQAGTMVRGESNTVLYPQMEKEFNPRYLNLVFAHLDACKDVCDHFGITTTLVPHNDKQTGKVIGFTAKSFRNPEEKDDYDFAYDPFWDDGTDFDELYKGIDDEYGDRPKDPYPEIVNKVPDSDEEIIDISKKWVNKLMSDMGVCPFTQGADLAGLPLGNVFYCVDRSTGFEDMYHRYWKEVVRLERNNEKDVSTVLLIAPEFCLDNIELFDSFTNTLTQPLAALGIEDLLQLVFFHPQWSFRDGSARSGEQEAANYARRSPWPMFNLLRTSQVRTAQKGIPTGLVYKQNEKTLQSVGVDKLETMLRLRDWSDVADLKVNRREMDALKIAQDFQATGVIQKEDMSLAHDATPAANKVDSRQVEEGDLVNVLLQALGKRLGKEDGENKPAQALTGPETSAAAMATDFLIKELDTIVDKAAKESAAAAPVEKAEQATVKKDEVEAKEATEIKATEASVKVKKEAVEATGSKEKTPVKEATKVVEEVKELKEAEEETVAKGTAEDKKGAKEAKKETVAKSSVEGKKEPKKFKEARDEPVFKGTTADEQKVNESKEKTVAKGKTEDKKEAKKETVATGTTEDEKKVKEAKKETVTTTEAKQEQKKETVKAATEKEGDKEKPKEDEKEYKETDELRKAKEARLEEARKALFNDLREAENPKKPGPPRGRGDAESDVYFGKGGISEALSDQDELFQEGMNPDNFY